MKTYVGIDNGVTGSIGILSEDESIFKLTPVFQQLSYTKTRQYVTRLDGNMLLKMLTGLKNPQVILERPLVNPQRFKATLSAMRCLEATQIVVELLDIPYIFIDSKIWQHELFPKNLKSDELKAASADIGCRLFPAHKELIKKHGDADSLLIAEYARRHNL